MGLTAHGGTVKTKPQDAMEQSADIREMLPKSRGATVVETTSMECLHDGAIYKGTHESFGKGWMCGCGKYMAELPNNYAVVFMAFPLLKDIRRPEEGQK
jgi:hypothetical protein